MSNHMKLKSSHDNIEESWWGGNMSWKSRREEREEEYEDEYEEGRLHEEYEEHNERYKDFKVHKPMHEIRRERDRTFTRDDDNKRVNFGKYRGRGWTRKHERGLPKRERSGPVNRTRGQSPFSYESGICISRKRKSQSIRSLGVPWKR